MKLLKMLLDYEKRWSPRLHPNGNVRFKHWYRLNLFSDGSGFVNDSCGATVDDQQVLFRFGDVEELEKNLNR